MDVGVYNKSIKSGKWFLLNVFGQKAINFATFFTLARMLDPRDYGIIGVVLIINGLLDQFTNPSFGQALTREKRPIEQYLDPMWTFDILRYSVIAVVLFFSADAIGHFFHFVGPESTMLRWSGLMLLIPAFSNVRQIYFFKELKFEKIFIRDMVTQLAFALAAIGYAFYIEPGVWALFVGYIVSYVSAIAMTYILYPSRPELSLKFARLRDLVSYSKWVYGQNLLEVALSQFDKLLVGRLLNPTSLGLYSKAKDLASTTTAIMTSLIAKVGFSAFSKVQDQMEKVRRGFLQSIDVLILSGLPVTLLLLLEGGLIVTLLLGDRWLGLVVPLKIFALGNLFLAFVRVVNPVIAALGRPDVNFKTNAFQAVVMLPLMYLGFVFYGLNGLAWAVVVTWILLLMYVILRARPILNIPVRAFIPAISTGAIGSLAVFMLDAAGRSLIHLRPTPLVVIAWIGGLGALYYGCVYFVSRRFSYGPRETMASIWQVLFSKK
jgi:O-antigen/teichoic acid export membrane protein